MGGALRQKNPSFYFFLFSCFAEYILWSSIGENVCIIAYFSSSSSSDNCDKTRARELFLFLFLRISNIIKKVFVFAQKKF
jgi:hypothetical protein